MSKHVHHTSVERNEGICPLCEKPFLMYWYDAEELNGRSDTTSRYKGQQVHYYCIPGARSLQEINAERKKKFGRNQK